MDSISQAALGAAIGEAVLGRDTGNKGAILGAIIATLPDLDVVLYLFYSKLEMLSIHRGISHSILFCFLGSLVISLVLKRMKGLRQIAFLRLWTFAWLALFTHTLLDTFTAYGTQLYSPFSDKRLGFDSINVVDPVYTVPLLLGLLFSLSLFKNSPKRATYNYVGLGLSTFYLFCTLGIKNHVNHRFHDELSKQGIQYNSLLTMPVGSGNINWYGVAKSNDSLYTQKYSILKGSSSAFEQFAINDHLLDNVNAELVETMRWFSKGFYVVQDEEDEIRFYNLQVDMRGVYQFDDIKVPTLGYFVVRSKTDKAFNFSSGTHRKD